MHEPCQLSTEKDLIALDASLNSETGSNRYLNSDLEKLNNSLVEYLATIEIEQRGEATGVGEVDFLSMKADSDIVSEDNVPALERLRSRYETSRLNPSIYAKRIRPLSIHHKLFALHAFTLLWWQSNDIRHLNVSLKLAEDICRETKGLKDVQFMMFFARCVRDLMLQIREFHEKSDAP